MTGSGLCSAHLTQPLKKTMACQVQAAGAQDIRPNWIMSLLLLQAAVGLSPESRILSEIFEFSFLFTNVSHFGNCWVSPDNILRSQPYCKVPSGDVCCDLVKWNWPQLKGRQACISKTFLSFQLKLSGHLFRCEGIILIFTVRALKEFNQVSCATCTKVMDTSCIRLPQLSSVIPLARNVSEHLRQWFESARGNLNRVCCQLGFWYARNSRWCFWCKAKQILAVTENYTIKLNI